VTIGRPPEMCASDDDSPTPLARRIADRIRRDGPIGIDTYFDLCLADPDYGYYRTRQPFGAAGDFITAPEVTQFFGEMIAVFLINAWHLHGRPGNVRIVEMGPGRGTLIKDALRVIAMVAPDLAQAGHVHLVETSERLRAVQAETLSRYDGPIAWHDTFEEVPEGFVLLVANELFDALPIRQFIRTEDGDRERLVGLDAQGALTFTMADEPVSPGLDVEGVHPVGTIIEIAPAREALAAELAHRLARDGGVALIIDYGHLAGVGDTLQAMRAHRFDPPLAHPGEADLTSHVDFAALAEAARGAGAHVAGLAHQGDFLIGLGLLERAGRFGADKDSETRTEIRDAVERIAGSGAGKMGDLFKVLALAGTPAKLPPFRARQQIDALSAD
jgi:SAM-dependent MidA family methyltransferase